MVGETLLFSHKKQISHFSDVAVFILSWRCLTINYMSGKPCVIHLMSDVYVTSVVLSWAVSSLCLLKSSIKLVHETHQSEWSYYAAIFDVSFLACWCLFFFSFFLWWSVSEALIVMTWGVLNVFLLKLFVCSSLLTFLTPDPFSCLHVAVQQQKKNKESI